MTKREWYSVCSCGFKGKVWGWNYDLPLDCPECKNKVEHPDPPGSQSAAVIGDEIDVVIRHGLVNPDGSPRRFRSMKELKQEANRRGLTIAGDTPKPYRV